MHFLSRIFLSKHEASASANQVVTVSFDITDEMGTDEERERANLLGDTLEIALDKAKAGEYDGNSFSDGECSLYLYGDDADKILRVIRPVLHGFKIKPLLVTVRYGNIQDDTARVETEQII